MPSTEPTPQPLTPSRLTRRGLTRRCPLCGGRGVFESWYRRRDRCPTCNFPTNRVEDQWIGSYGLHIVVSFVLLFAVIVLGFAVTYPDPPIGVLMAISLATAVFVPVLLYPISASLWSAIDLAMRGPDIDDDIDPRHLPPPA